MHEIARHGVHVNETLSVAARSLGALRQYHDLYLKNVNQGGSKSKNKTWDTIGSRLRFQLDLLENLNERSVANNARIQNEITLVRCCPTLMKKLQLISIGFQCSSTEGQQNSGQDGRRVHKGSVGNESHRCCDYDILASHIRLGKVLFKAEALFG